MGKRTGRMVLAFAAAIATTATAATAEAGDRSSRDDIEHVEGSVELLSTYTAATGNIDGDKLVSVIITLDEEAVASYDGGIAGFDATSPTSTGAARLDTNSEEVAAYTRLLEVQHAIFASTLESRVVGASVTQTYEIVVGGVAALVPADSLDKIAKLPKVTGVFRDELNHLDTEVSPGFIGADGLWVDLGGQSEAGEGVIVGVIDSGIWPEHPSVSDPDPAGNPYDPPPAHWTGTGSGAGCDFGDTAFNPADDPFSCNNKLLGAYDFTDTYKAVVGLLPTEFDSARDSNGHGTHTLTTSAGNGGVAATLLGVPRGDVSGIAPRAHVVAYKGCGFDGCFSSDTMASIEQAVADGVDVVNYSISGGGNPYGDVTSLAFLDAYNAGTLVVPSAGNSGPGADTVAHREPWTLTVGASTTDRHFLSTVSLLADNSDTLDVVGATVTDGITTPTPVIFPPAGEELCLTPFAPGTFSGEIVICDRGVIARVAKSFNVSEGGAGGMLLVNLAPQGLATDNHFIPSVHLEDTDGAALRSFVGTHTGVTGTFTPGTATTVPGDVMAAFSSRGGPGQTLGISKPDVTAPGVQILAGMTPLPENEEGGLPGQLFQSIQGTSMSAPHSTGSAALVKAAHPDWGPGEIKSALMTTGKTAGVTKEDGSTPGDAFDYGSGRILPDDAADAQLAIVETGPNFLALENNLWDANYPSLYVPNLAGAITVERTVSNPTPDAGSWDLSVVAPPDLTIDVPASIGVLAGGDSSFDIAVDGRDVPIGEVRHATLTLEKTNEPMLGQLLTFPITVVKGEGGVTIDKTCTPTSIAQGATTDCEITVQNTTSEVQDVSIFDEIPDQLAVDKMTLVGGTIAECRVGYDGSLVGASSPAPSVTIDPFASPVGYLDLTSFSPTDIGATDESIANFSVPTFEYGGVSYDTIGIVSNGYVIVGGGTGADVAFINSDLPDAAIPNNVLAPFWTDLNPAAGGTVYVETLTDGSDSWTVVEWQKVENFSDGLPNTAQVWLGWNTDSDPSQDISFTYGADVTGGDGGFLTVGAENGFGNAGGTTYFDGAGAPPTPSFGNPGIPAGAGYEVDVSATPGSPGGSHTLSYTAAGKALGPWMNVAELTSTGVVGTATASESGETTTGAAGSWPTVSITPAGGQPDPTEASPIDFTVEFSVPVTGFSPEDVLLGGTAGPTTASVTGSGSAYNVAVSGMTGDGIVTAAVRSCAATDGSATSTASPTAAEVTYNASAPTATVTKAAGQDDPTNGSPIDFTVVFSEAVFGFTSGDVILGGSAAPTTDAVTGSGSTYNVAISGMIGDGTVAVTVPAGAAVDDVGNPNQASAAGIVTYDTTKPTVTIDKASAQADPTSDSSIDFTVEFSEVVDGFESGDVIVGGSAGATTAVVTGADTTYNVAVSGMTAEGTVTAAVPAGAANDGAGNTNEASSTAEVTYDLMIPTFIPVTPYRFEDTRRPGGGPVGSADGSGAELRFNVLGRGGLPLTGVEAVSLNLTVVDGQLPTLGGGFVTVDDCTFPRPATSNLNFGQGQTVPNAVITPVSPTGDVCVYVYGIADILVDVNGYFPTGSDFGPLLPFRLEDTRGGTPVGSADGSAPPLMFNVLDRGGVPAGGVEAVSLNITAVDGLMPTLGSGYVTVDDCSTPPPPATSNLNFGQGQTVPNAVITPVSPTGDVCVYVYGIADILVDINGYFPTGSDFGSLSPFRLEDTRGGTPVGSADGSAPPLMFNVLDRGGVPATGVGAVSLNITAVDGQMPTVGGGYVTVDDCSTPPPPATSNLNFGQDQTVPNAVLTPVSPTGDVCVYVYGIADILVDINGYFP